MGSVGQAIQPTWWTQRSRAPAREWLPIVLFMAASSIFLFFDPKTPPVALQDEARNAINALEMYLRGYSLVTTFNFHPDLWNTKPPLLIWGMTASMTVFGPSEWAIRLPSALAALGMLLCTLLFVRRITGSLLMAVGAALILLLSPGFFGEHGARTADFDAPLAFFVTAGLQLTFFTIHRARPRIRSMLAIGGLIALGAMTKSIAAFIPLPGVLLYLAIVGCLNRAMSHWRRYALAAMVAVAPLLLFYALREAAGPGYLSAAIHNDILGRFNETLIRPTSPFYYVRELFLGWFVAGPFLAAAPLALTRCSTRTKMLFLYAASIAGVSLLVYSAASNRAVQYALPVLPWLSIMAVLTIRYLLEFLARMWRAEKRTQAVVFGAAFLLASGQLIYRAGDWRFVRFPARQFYPESSYGDLFAALSARGVTKITVVEPGVLHFGEHAYAPLFRWNQLIWQRKGMAIVRKLGMRSGDQIPLASCNPQVFSLWGGSAEQIGQCAVLWPLPQR